MRFEWSTSSGRTKSWPDDFIEEVMTESTNSYEEQTYLHVDVRNPRTHISREKALYTDYEIVILTNSIAFACKESSVRRRYSDFQWLRKRLLHLDYFVANCLPELPPKRFFGRFKRQFLKHRQAGLRKFLEQTLSNNEFLSDVGLHLFLQSTLSIVEISLRLAGHRTDQDTADRLEASLLCDGGKARGLIRSSSLIDKQAEVAIDWDSGYSNSTASSMTEFIRHPTMRLPHGQLWTYFKSMPADLDKVLETSNSLQFKDRQSVLDAQAALDVHSALDDQVVLGPQSSAKRSHCRSASQYSLPADVSSTRHIQDAAILRTPGSRQNSVSGNEAEYFSAYYDADDEVDAGAGGADDDVDSDLFTMAGSGLSTSSSQFSLDRATEILQARPKLSVRMSLNFSDPDSDDCFRESEYDVIDSENDDMFTVDDGRGTAYNPSKLRSFSESTALIELVPSLKNKTRTGKVKSMPNIRFPIRSRTRSAKSKSLQGSLRRKSRRLLNDLQENEEHVGAPSETPRKPLLFLPPRPFYRSESELTRNSETDYLQTVHQGTELSDAPHDLDSQAEDLEPKKYWDFLRHRRRMAASALLARTQPAGTDETRVQRTHGRFSITPVIQAKAPDDDMPTEILKRKFDSDFFKNAGKPSQDRDARPRRKKSHDRGKRSSEKGKATQDLENNNVRLRDSLKPVQTSVVCDAISEVVQECNMPDEFAVTSVPEEHVDGCAGDICVNGEIFHGDRQPSSADCRCGQHLKAGPGESGHSGIRPDELPDVGSVLTALAIADNDTPCKSNLHSDSCGVQASGVVTQNEVGIHTRDHVQSVGDKPTVRREVRVCCQGDAELRITPVEAVRMQTLNEMKCRTISKKRKVSQSLASILDTYDIIPSFQSYIIEPL